MSMCEQRIFIIIHMDSFSYYQSLHCHGLQLPWILSYNSILVVVDYFTKMAHFIPFKKTIIGKKITKLFFYHVFQYHYLLKDFLLSWTLVCI
jgi:hypothetical protein